MKSALVSRLRADGYGTKEAKRCSRHRAFKDLHNKYFASLSKAVLQRYKHGKVFLLDGPEVLTTKALLLAGLDPQQLVSVNKDRKIVSKLRRLEVSAVHGMIVPVLSEQPETFKGLCGAYVDGVRASAEACWAEVEAIVRVLPRSSFVGWTIYCRAGATRRLSFDRNFQYVFRQLHALGFAPLGGLRNLECCVASHKRAWTCWLVRDFPVARALPLCQSPDVASYPGLRSSKKLPRQGLQASKLKAFVEKGTQRLLHCGYRHEKPKFQTPDGNLWEAMRTAIKRLSTSTDQERLLRRVNRQLPWAKHHFKEWERRSLASVCRGRKYFQKQRRALVHGQVSLLATYAERYLASFPEAHLLIDTEGHDVVGPLETTMEERYRRRLHITGVSASKLTPGVKAVMTKGQRFPLQTEQSAVEAFGSAGRLAQFRNSYGVIFVMIKKATDREALEARLEAILTLAAAPQECVIVWSVQDKSSAERLRHWLLVVGHFARHGYDLVHRLHAGDSPGLLDHCKCSDVMTEVMIRGFN